MNIKSTAKGLTILLLLAAAAFSTAFAAPKPSPVPTEWQFEINLDSLRAITMRVPGETEPRTFWYLRYRLINRTGDERMFIPQIALYTNTGQLIRAGKNVPVSVFRKIQSVFNDPILRDQTAMTGLILQGADNAPRGVMIFPDFDPDAGTVKIFVGGLSGEQVRVNLPVPVTVKAINADGELVDTEVDQLNLVKTLQLTFKISGDLKRRENLSATLVDKEWVMR
ncbi:MAG: hypothetical protein ACLFUJ_09305 [Phycisphaerae bacterium]